jgi:hypothetical protein
MENAIIQETCLIRFAMTKVLSIPDFRNTCQCRILQHVPTTIDFSHPLCRINTAVATGVHETFPIGFVIRKALFIIWNFVDYTLGSINRSLQ